MNLKPGQSILFLVLLFLLGGCVERQIYLRSSPPGAQVFLDGQPMGVTPLSIEFTHYGQREVVLRKRNHSLVKKRIVLEPPIYEVFPLDFISEVLIPYPFRDVHEFHFKLDKSPSFRYSSEEVKAIWERGEKYRRKQ